MGEIAGEKAGILKKDVTCVVSRQHPEAREVIEDRAASVGAKLLIEGQDWQSYKERGRLVVEDQTGLVDVPLPNLIGPHQIGNAGTAIVGLRALGFGETACLGAVENAYWPARMQRLTSGPLFDKLDDAEVWLDGGHNPAAAEVVRTFLQRYDVVENSVSLVLGMMGTKDAANSMKIRKLVAALSFRLGSFVRNH